MELKKILTVLLCFFMLLSCSDDDNNLTTPTPTAPSSGVFTQGKLTANINGEEKIFNTVIAYVKEGITYVTASINNNPQETISFGIKNDGTGVDAMADSGVEYIINGGKFSSNMYHNQLDLNIIENGNSKLSGELSGILGKVLYQDIYSDIIIKNCSFTLDHSKISAPLASENEIMKFTVGGVEKIYTNVKLHPSNNNDVNGITVTANLEENSSLSNVITFFIPENVLGKATMEEFNYSDESNMKHSVIDNIGENTSVTLLQSNNKSQIEGVFSGTLFDNNNVAKPITGTFKIKRNL